MQEKAKLLLAMKTPELNTYIVSILEEKNNPESTLAYHTIRYDTKLFNSLDIPILYTLIKISQ